MKYIINLYNTVTDAQAVADRLGITGTVSTATAESIADDNSAGNVATADEKPWSDVDTVSTTAKQEDSSLSYFEKLAQDA